MENFHTYINYNFEFTCIASLLYTRCCYQLSVVVIIVIVTDKLLNMCYF